jgi:hypothetical protein
MYAWADCQSKENNLRKDSTYSVLGLNEGIVDSDNLDIIVLDTAEEVSTRR